MVLLLLLLMNTIVHSWILPPGNFLKDFVVAHDRASITLYLPEYSISKDFFIIVCLISPTFLSFLTATLILLKNYFTLGSNAGSKINRFFVQFQLQESKIT